MVSDNICYNKLKIVQVQDLTYSFGSFQSDIKANVSNFVDQLDEFYPQTKFGLVSFRDKPLPLLGDSDAKSTDYCYRNHTNGFKLAEYFQNTDLDLPTASGGGDYQENQFGAILNALNDPSFKSLEKNSGEAKVQLIITDERAHGANFGCPSEQEGFVWPCQEGNLWPISNKGFDVKQATQYFHMSWMNDWSNTISKTFNYDPVEHYCDQEEYEDGECTTCFRCSLKNCELGTNCDNPCTDYELEKGGQKDCTDKVEEFKLHDKVNIFMMPGTPSLYHETNFNMLAIDGNKPSYAQPLEKYRRAGRLATDTRENDLTNIVGDLGQEYAKYFGAIGDCTRNDRRALGVMNYLSQVPRLFRLAADKEDVLNNIIVDARELGTFNDIDEDNRYFNIDALRSVDVFSYLDLTYNIDYAVGIGPWVVDGEDVEHGGATLQLNYQQYKTALEAYYNGEHPVFKWNVIHKDRYNKYFDENYDWSLEELYDVLTHKDKCGGSDILDFINNKEKPKINLDNVYNKTHTNLLDNTLFDDCEDMKCHSADDNCEYPFWGMKKGSVGELSGNTNESIYERYGNRFVNLDYDQYLEPTNWTNEAFYMYDEEIHSVQPRCTNLRDDKGNKVFKNLNQRYEEIISVWPDKQFVSEEDCLRTEYPTPKQVADELKTAGVFPVVIVVGPKPESIKADSELKAKEEYNTYVDQIAYGCADDTLSCRVQFWEQVFTRNGYEPDQFHVEGVYAEQLSEMGTYLRTIINNYLPACGIEDPCSSPSSTVPECDNSFTTSTTTTTYEQFDCDNYFFLDNRVLHLKSGAFEFDFQFSDSVNRTNNKEMNQEAIAKDCRLVKNGDKDDNDYRNAVICKSVQSEDMMVKIYFKKDENFETVSIGDIKKDDGNLKFLINIPKCSAEIFPSNDHVGLESTHTTESVTTTTARSTEPTTTTTTTTSTYGMDASDVGASKATINTNTIAPTTASMDASNVGASKATTTASKDIENPAIPTTENPINTGNPTVEGVTEPSDTDNTVEADSTTTVEGVTEPSDTDNTVEADSTTTSTEEGGGMGTIAGAAGGAVAGVGAVVAGLMAKGVIPGFKSNPGINVEDADIDIQENGIEREIFADIDESMFHA